MSNQTPREQLTQSLNDLFTAGRLQGQKAVPAAVWDREIGMALDTVLVIFKGLPAMQKEKTHFRTHPDASSQVQRRVERDVVAAESRNDLRRQILAELEEKSNETD